MIHDIINARYWLSETDNVFNREKRPVRDTERDHYNLAGLVIRGRAAYLQELASAWDYCPDCSSERGRRIEHKRDVPFQAFRLRYKRFAAKLDELTEIII